MVDTVYFYITQAEAEGVNFLDEIPPHLTNAKVSEPVAVDTSSPPDNRDERTFTGHIGNLKVFGNRWKVKVGFGSLCKFMFADNFHTMGRADIKRAVEALSDTLHLPMDRAKITRLDVAQNIIVKNPPEVYLNHLGVMPNAKRFINDGSLYYQRRGVELCFYDKVSEQKRHKEPIPELYRDRNVLRFEQRYKRGLGEAFKVEAVNGSMLYDEKFYIELLNRWRADYTAIRKVNDIQVNFEYMKGVRELALLGKLSYIEQMGGEIAFLEQIAEAQRQGQLTKTQAFRLREDIKNTCRERVSLTTKSEAIAELDKKIGEAIRFYR